MKQKKKNFFLFTILGFITHCDYHIITLLQRTLNRNNPEIIITNHMQSEKKNFFFLFTIGLAPVGAQALACIQCAL